MLDFSADFNQNHIKVESCGFKEVFSENFGYFPTPDSDPFKDDPLSKPHSIHMNSVDTNGTAGGVMNAVNSVLNVDSEHLLTQQINELSSQSMIRAISNGFWPLGGRISHESSNSIIDGNDVGSSISTANPFYEKNPTLTNGTPPEQSKCTHNHRKDSVVISPPPQNSKAGRRRSTKVIVVLIMVLLHVGCI